MTIEFKKTSWHYRLLTECFEPLREPAHKIPENLCPYCYFLFWHLIKMISLYFIIAVFILGFIIAPIDIYLFNIGLGHYIPNEGISDFCDLVIVCGVALWVVLFFTLILVFYCCFLDPYLTKLSKRQRDNWSNRPFKKDAEPSVIREWIKAKHEKICPKIDFVDK